MERYTSKFEEEYWSIVDNKISINTQNIQNKLLASCKKYLPKDFFDSESPTFKELVLAPYEKLKKAESHIKKNSWFKMRAECFDSKCKNASDINDLYIEIYNAFKNVMDAQRNKTSMRVRIVKEADLTVCPYCNRDYINCRADNVSGAQLDHFFSKSDYPVFAVSLYNLVPVCANCNRIKSAQKKEFASPFDETINWEDDVKFVYQPKSLDSVKIDIKSGNPAIVNNIEALRIKEAYQIHEFEILELQDKQQAYSESQKQEIQEVLHKVKISDDEIKRIIFGPKITPKDIRKKPLGKMISDLHKDMKIY